MTDYIRSNTIKKYLRENHIVLTDEMTAALISSRSYVNGIKKTHKALREIQGQTADGVLKRQIEIYRGRSGKSGGTQGIRQGRFL